MPSTPLKLPKTLKLRIGSLAELRERFVQEAQAAAAEVDAHGEVFAASEVHEYLRSKLAGKNPSKPQASKR